MSYTITPYSEKSIVLRTTPANLFQPYSEYLKNANGKYNPNLKHPTTPDAKLPGWIFSNKHEQNVRHVAESILNTINSQTPQTTYPGSSQTAYPGSSQTAYPGPSQTAYSGPTVPGRSTLIATPTQVTPEVGKTLYLVTPEGRYPMTITGIEKCGPYVTGADIKFGEQLSKIVLGSDYRWQVPGFNTLHTIEN